MICFADLNLLFESLKSYSNTHESPHIKSIERGFGLRKHSSLEIVSEFVAELKLETVVLE